MMTAVNSLSLLLQQRTADGGMADQRLVSYQPRIEYLVIKQACV